MAQCQQVYKLLKEARLIKGKKIDPRKQQSFREDRVAVLEAKTDNNNNESLFADENPKANNRNNPALDRKGSRTRQSHADT